jgi:hypothetical protein
LAYALFASTTRLTLFLEQNTIEQMMMMQMLANQQAQNNAMIAAAGVSLHPLTAR